MNTDNEAMKLARTAYFDWTDSAGYKQTSHMESTTAQDMDEKALDFASDVESAAFIAGFVYGTRYMAQVMTWGGDGK